MNTDFIQDLIDDEATPRLIGCLTGWEAIVFEVEDEPAGEAGYEVFVSALSTAAIAP